MVWQIRVSPTRPVFLMDASSSPSCFTSDLAPYSQLEKSSRDGPSSWETHLEFLAPGLAWPRSVCYNHQVSEPVVERFSLSLSQLNN